MSKPRATHPRVAHDALAYGSPLAALRAHAMFLRAPRGSCDIGFLRSLVGSGDRLACALAIRPLARFAGSDFDTALHTFARGDDPLLQEQAVWALADRPATPAGIEVVVDAIAEGGHRATIAQITIEHWAASDRAVVGAIPPALERHSEDGARVRLVETAAVTDHPDIPPLLARLLRSTDEHEVVRAPRRSTRPTVLRRRISSPWYVSSTTIRLPASLTRPGPRDTGWHDERLLHQEQIAFRGVHPGRRCLGWRWPTLLDALAGRGSRLALAGRDSSNLDDVAVDETATLRFDLASDTAPRLVAAAAEGLGGLDGVVCRAGAVAFGPLDETPIDALQEIVAVDVVGSLLLARAAIPILPAEGFMLNFGGVTETGLTGRALHGEPPGMCAGLDPSVVAERLGSRDRRRRTRRPRERLHAVTRLPDLDDERHQRRPDDR